MTDKTVAITILKQLGGNHFIAMTGAKSFGCSDNSFSCSFKGSRKANGIRITLNSMDTYDIKFFKMTSKSFDEVGEFLGIYNDSLQEVFTDFTGLNTHL